MPPPDPSPGRLWNATPDAFFKMCAGYVSIEAAAIIALLLYAGLLRFTRNPARIFTIVSAIVFVLTAIPDFTYIPTVPGSTPAQTAVLVMMHVIAASVIVRLLTTARKTTA